MASQMSFHIIVLNRLPTFTPNVVRRVRFKCIVKFAERRHLSAGNAALALGTLVDDEKIELTMEIGISFSTVFFMEWHLILYCE